MISKIIEDAWVINLMGNNKWSKLMNIFKRKKKPIKRMVGGFMSPRRELTEQEYIDAEFKAWDKKLDFFMEEIEILKTLMDKDHIIISPHFNLDVKGMEESLTNDEARKWARENDYSYVKSFKEHGEIWIKEKTN